MEILPYFNFTELRTHLAELDARPAPPSWYFPLTDEAWTMPRKYHRQRGVALWEQPTDMAAAIAQTTQRLLKQSYAQELAAAGSEEALKVQKEAYQAAEKERKQLVMQSIRENSVGLIRFADPSAEETAAFDALPAPPEWYFSDYAITDFRRLWEPATATESWEEMDARISELERYMRKKDFYNEVEKVGSVEQLRALKVEKLQAIAENMLWRFCHGELA